MERSQLGDCRPFIESGTTCRMSTGWTQNVEKKSDLNVLFFGRLLAVIPMLKIQFIVVIFISFKNVS
jgi:hypothetical protein